LDRYAHEFKLCGLDIRSCYVLVSQQPATELMKDGSWPIDAAPEWRFPTEEQDHAKETARRVGATTGATLPDAAPNCRPDGADLRTDMPEEYWQSVLTDPRAGARTDVAIQQRRLSEISLHLLRVSCRRCDRVVEIQTADAVRLTARRRSGRTRGGGF
jgi:hypothetical protein